MSTTAPARPDTAMSGSSNAAPRTALVTGGTAGIGAAIAQALLAAGYRVAVNDVYPAAPEACTTKTYTS